MKSAQNDMTAGNPMKIICGFTLPIFIGNVFQQFYNMADAVIVGKFVGNKALAAVGSTGRSRNSFASGRSTSDSTFYGIYEASSDPYEYTRGYFCGCICIYHDRQRWYPGTDAL